MTFTQECVIPVERAASLGLPDGCPERGPLRPQSRRHRSRRRRRVPGGFKVQVGPIRLALQGAITIEDADRTAGRARMRAEANDRRLGGGIRARLSLTLSPAEAGTRVQIETDLAVLGKIGEFGQPIIRKKADALLEEFARNLRSALAT